MLRPLRTEPGAPAPAPAIARPRRTAGDGGELALLYALIFVFLAVAPRARD